MKTETFDGEEYVSTAELNAGLPFVMQAKDMEAWGFTPRKIRAGSWWLVGDIGEILDHVDQLVDEFRASVQRRGNHS
jgi:hypothetical protein